MKSLFLALQLCLCSSLLASSSIPDELINELAKSPQWLKLIHVTQKDNIYRSDIETASFYLSEQLNPKQELLKTLEAFSRPKVNNEIHAQCRFPARRLWLRTKLQAHAIDIETVKCEKFDDWYGKINADSVSLVFANGYLDNPASYYGHILFKFNKKNQSTSLTDYSLNYGARVPDDPNPVAYIFNGLLGGYDAVFSDELFYRHNHSYGEVDLRDIWEYQLNLTEFEVNLLILHSWELLNVRFTYYFLKENCAYRMAELLELVLDKPLINRSDKFIFPIEVFNNAIEIKQNGESLIAEIIRIPSRQSRFTEKYGQLSDDEKEIVRASINNQLSFLDSRYLQLPETSKAKILETLLDYYEFLKIKKIVHNKKSTILLERLKLDSDLIKWQEINKLPAHLAQKPQRFGVSYIDNDLSTYAINYRLSYYDFLTPDYGRVKNAKLENLVLEFRDIDSQLRLHKATLFDIHTLNLSETGLPHDGGYSWRVKLSYDPLANYCNDCYVYNFNYGIGQAIQFSDQLTWYSSVNLNALSNNRFIDQAYGSVSSGLLLTISDRIKVNLDYERFDFTESTGIENERTTGEIRFGDSNQYDLRYKYIKQGKLGIEHGITINYYY
ncbi:MAG: DUF4105 domain-containing protein [Kangiellaceae bacterium]|jgi:hypothetical protein|nr:DUF4105 domain-containing protein [Kangiellaceae bacterium]